MITTTATGAPNQVCHDLRDAIKAGDLPPRLSAHLDACVERAVHAFAGQRESVSVTMVIGEDVFSLTFV